MRVNKQGNKALPIQLLLRHLDELVHIRDTMHSISRQMYGKDNIPIPDQSLPKESITTDAKTRVDIMISAKHLPESQRLNKDHIKSTVDGITVIIHDLQSFSDMRPRALSESNINYLATNLVQLKEYIEDCRKVFSALKNNAHFCSEVNDHAAFYQTTRQDAISQLEYINKHLQPILNKLPGEFSSDLGSQAKEFLAYYQGSLSTNHTKVLDKLCNLRAPLKTLRGYTSHIIDALNTNILPSIPQGMLNKWSKDVGDFKTALESAIPALDKIAGRSLINLETNEPLFKDGKESSKLSKARDGIVDLGRLHEKFEGYMPVLDEIMKQLPNQKTEEQRKLFLNVRNSSNGIMAMQPELKNVNQNKMALQDYFHREMNSPNTARA